MLYVMAGRKARNEAWDEILILNHENRVCESSSGNIWIVKDGNIQTPPSEEFGISGVMRNYLLQTLPQHGLAVQETPLTQEDLHLADEIWISNAVRGVRWVAKWDFRKYGSEIANQVQLLLQKENKPND